MILGVGNIGETSRDVFVEEHLRPAQKRRVDHAWPKKPSAAGDVLRTKLAVKPGAIARTGYTSCTSSSYRVRQFVPVSENV